MAAITIAAHFAQDDDARVDGLCPQCWNPGLKLYHIQRVNMTGITELGTRVWCPDCKVWTTDLSPFKEATA